MSHVMPQVALHRIIYDGVKLLKQNIDLLDDVFQYYLAEPMANEYGQTYVDNIKTWFLATKIPVVQAWSMNPAQVPQITIALASEQEDLQKAAIGDHFGEDEEGNVGVGVFGVQLDVSIYGSKTTDEVLWLYYIVNYILFKRKRQAEALGLQLHTFSASDYNRNSMAMSAENIYVRTIKFSTTVQNTWDSEPFLDLNDLEITITPEPKDD